MRTEKRVIGDIMPAALFAVLFSVILILVVFCAKGYGGITCVREANGETRTLLTYVNTTVKANETADVRIEDRGGKEVLCIEDPSTGYEQLLFLEDGKIFELYGPAGQDIVVNVIDTDSTDPEYIAECEEMVRELESAPYKENYYE